jgi:hypothetical protein
MTTFIGLAVPVRPCEPWCEVGTGEHATQHPDDRSCWSTYNVVPLSRHKPQETVDGDWLQARLNVYLRRRAGEPDSLIYLHSEETDEELLLTLPEAHELHRVLGELIQTAGATA